jgi:hypothetical protein
VSVFPFITSVTSHVSNFVFRTRHSVPHWICGINCFVYQLNIYFNIDTDYIRVLTLDLQPFTSWSQIFSATWLLKLWWRWMKRNLEVSGNFLCCCLVLLWEGPVKPLIWAVNRVRCETSTSCQPADMPANTFVNVKCGSHNFMWLCVEMIHWHAVI